jgi:hypothetical protein
MNERLHIRTNLILGICILATSSVGIGSIAGSYNRGQPQSSGTVQKEKRVIKTTHARGAFEVKLTPQSPDDKAAGATVGRFSIDKQFRGDLEGTSKGEMLAVSTGVPGSAGYVAMEHITGTLNGRAGTFALQHTGTMNRGKPQLSVTVVPDSGTGALVGLAGKMEIMIADGKHSYEFEYTLAEAP